MRYTMTISYGTFWLAHQGGERMETTIASPMAQVRTDATRRAGWLFIAAFAAIVLLAVGQGGFYAEMEAQLVAAAIENGGQRPPMEEFSRITAQYSRGVAFETMFTLFGVLPYALLAAAVFGVRGLVRESAPRLAALAGWCALGMLLAWLVPLYLAWGIAFGPGRWPPFTEYFDLLYSPLVFAVVWLASGAIAAAALGLWQRRTAPRLALAALVVAALFIVGNIALALGTGLQTGLPPVVPFVPALLLGIGLVRARPG